MLSESELGELSTGDTLSYDYDAVTYNFKVIDTSDERLLPAVEVSASSIDAHGAEIVEKLNHSELRGILLGTCEVGSGELVHEGLLRPGDPDHGVLVEMVQDGEMVNSVFPMPTTPIRLTTA
jgi:hypothetical protein